MSKGPLAFSLFFLFLLISGIAAAQAPRTGTIAGRVKDASNQQPLEAVTISAVRSGDSLLINHTSSNGQGRYRLTGLPLNKPFEVFITRKGYQDTFAVFTLTPEKPLLDSLDWLIRVQPIELKGVSVVAKRAPFTYRNDTLEFNATAYKVKPNGTVRDLLLKLPGVEEDANGQLTVFGKKVDRIQLEGQDFYDNLDMSAENLPADIIEKIQVTTTKLEREKLTPGPKKPSQNLTINLTLKNNKKQGFLGKGSVSAGTDRRYAADLSVNRFGGKLRLGAAMNAGNIPRGNAYGSRGISDVKSLGITTGLQLNKKARLDVNYAHNRTNNEMSTEVERINFLPDSSFTNRSSSGSLYNSQGHNINGNFNYEVDSLSQVYINFSAGINKNGSNGTNRSASLSEEGTVINTMDSRQSDKSENQSYTLGVSYRRQTRNRKGSVNIQYGLSGNNNEGKGQQYTINTFQKAPADTIDQRTRNNAGTLSQSIAMELSYMLVKNLSFSAGYRYGRSDGMQQREVFNAGQGSYTERDSLLSNKNEMDNISQAPHLSLGYSIGKFGINLNSSWQMTEQRNHFIWQDSSIVIKQQQFSPSMNSSYSFENGSVSLNYQVNTSAPSPSYTSPVVDNRNPLAIVIGNPALRNSIDHNGSLNLSLFMPSSLMGGNFAIDGSFSQNQIVPDISYDSVRRQVTRYINTNGANNIGINGTLGKSARKGEWILRAGLQGGASRGQDVSYLEGKRNEAVSLSATGNFNVGASLKDFISAGGHVQYVWSNSSNSLAGLNDNKSTMTMYNLTCEMNGIKKMAASASYNYTINSQLPPDMGRRMQRLNARVERRFLPKEKLALSLAVNDIFNNRQDVMRRVTSSYVENRTGNSVGRFFLLKLQYNFDMLHEKWSDF